MCLSEIQGGSQVYSRITTTARKYLKSSNGEIKVFMSSQKSHIWWNPQCTLMWFNNILIIYNLMSDICSYMPLVIWIKKRKTATYVYKYMYAILIWFSFIRHLRSKYDWPFLKLTKIYNSRKSRVIMVSTASNFLQYSVFLNWLPQHTHTVDVENVHSIYYVFSRGCYLEKTKSAFP